MKRITLTYQLAMASSRDAGNKSMRDAGRKRWSKADWNAAAEKLQRLMPHLDPRLAQVAQS